ncbi:MAG: hypothetical protein ACK5PB_23715 [Pirellula sp.]|jgi:hypothetical protein
METSQLAKRGSRWSAIQPVFGALLGVTTVALFTVGPQATLRMTIEAPVGNIVFFTIFSLVVFLVFWLWRAVRRLLLLEVCATPFLRIAGGYTFIVSMLSGVILMKRIGILNWERFSPFYHYSIYVIYGAVCLGAVVELEQYVAKRFSATVA